MKKRGLQRFGHALYLQNKAEQERKESQKVNAIFKRLRPFLMANYEALIRDTNKLNQFMGQARRSRRYKFNQKWGKDSYWLREMIRIEGHLWKFRDGVK